MYHRVAEVQCDPWQLAVRPDHFEEQLLVLRRKFKVIPLQELVRQLHRRSVQRGSVCITFDDGYRDNFLYAKPILERYQCPATFFIATGYVDREQLFWWDELQHILLDSPVLPEETYLEIAGIPFRYHLGEESILSDSQLEQQNCWIAPDNPPTRRCELYFRLWERMKPLPEDTLQQTLLAIRQWARYHGQPEKKSWPLNSTQLQAIDRYPLFDVGLHTATHASMSLQPEAIQTREITNNREYLERICHRTVNILTYPYGDYNDTTVDVVKHEQITAAFTTDEHVVTSRSNPYSLGRFHVKSWNKRLFEDHLARWERCF